MDYVFYIGLFGSLVLVTGSAWPEKKGMVPLKSLKNWFLSVGALFMFTYSYLGYLGGGPIFFVFLQILAIVASILMMINISDVIDTTIIVICGVGLIMWSLFLFEGYNTIFFILGLIGIGLGYAFEIGSLRRSVALLLGSALIALFSYIEASWIFFWLNLFFAIFSAYYVYLGIKNKHQKKRFLFFFKR